ncbi:MAG TPA: DUF5985 family protein [Rhizomicrobium sp.]|nr:DUF5985 family protein [Rhizomicrobium sp.]
MNPLDPTVSAFMAGVLVAGYLVAALFFLRFWRRTGDGLFLCFAFAFALMAVNQGLPTFLGVVNEDDAGIFLFRLAAFVVIIFAIWRKNRARG